MEAVDAFSALTSPGCPSFFCGDAAGKPEIVGGGSSTPSLAFLLSCRAKSLACHHSRNFSAKILVGSRIFRLPSTRGYTVSVIVLGLNRLRVSPGLAPVRGGFGSVASEMAR